MLSLVTSLFKVDPKYKKYFTVAGLLLVFGYISLLAFVFAAFNKYDAAEASAKSHTNEAAHSKHSHS